MNKRWIGAGVVGLVLGVCSQGMAQQPGEAAPYTPPSTGIDCKQLPPRLVAPTSSLAVSNAGSLQTQIYTDSADPWECQRHTQLTVADGPKNVVLRRDSDGAWTLTWAPGLAVSAGNYNIKLKAQRGALVEEYTVPVIVTDCKDMPPALAPLGDQTITTNYGLYLTIAGDYGQPYECHDTMEVKLAEGPKGANLTKAGPGSWSLNWDPKDRTGEYQFRVEASRGGKVNSYPFKVNVEEEWETFFMPGVQYSLFAPTQSERFGTFQGIGIEYLVVGWIHRNENRGPSHGRLYVDLDLLFSDKEGVSEALMYTIGLQLSLERNPRRSFLIPFFGLDTGGFYQEEAGNLAHATPIGGIYLWASQNAFFHVTGGYFFPTRKLEELRGPRVRVGFNVSLW